MKVEIEIPAPLLPYVNRNDFRAKQTALLPYPYIANGDISNGKAAELLGMSKTELLDILICSVRWAYLTIHRRVKNLTTIFRC